MSIDETDVVNRFDDGPAVIVLAAGEGTRMRSGRSKMLHSMGGHSLLRHVLDAVEALQPSQLVVVVGYQREQVCLHLAEIAPGALVAVQNTPDGTGGAVMAALDMLGELQDQTEVIVTCGDMPLLRGATLRAIAEAHRRDGDAATSLVASSDDAWPCGADDDEGVYVFDYSALTDGLGHLASQRTSFSLIDVMAHARTTGDQVGTFVADDAWQVRGVDDRVQLALLGAEYNRRQVDRWMRAGVTILDPASTWIEADVDLAPDVTLLPGTMLVGATSVARGATIGPDTTIKDSEIGEDASITRSTVELAVVGDGAIVGPYTRLRPGTQIGPKGVVGTFVETKNATLGAGARLSHLTYCDDTTLGDGAEVGASVVFANWDAANRSRTEIGNGAVIGAGALIVPPIQVADGAMVRPGAAVLPPDVDLRAPGEPRRSSPEDFDATDAAKRGLKEDK
ncbi:MAG: NTP transferase domain-containing protein [Propionibacteriaceae bacterium]|nr:NTP transferase domain-containing protein [Propionibacteriaceae bacterium]